MIKRSAILLLLLAIGSFSILVFTSDSSAATATPVNNVPVKCSGGCKKTPVPVQWNIISPNMFPSES